MENPKRYDKQIALAQIGTAGQQKLSAAKVLIIGAGGLGCPVLQNLAGAGVGQLGIVDFDQIEETNLHRQLLYTSADIGKNKAVVAASTVLKQNPYIKIFPHLERFSLANALEITESYQIIVDCTDNNETRYLINDISLAKGIPMVYASIHQFEGQLSVFNYKDGPSYRCLFPERENLQSGNCDEVGVLGVLPNLLGVLQATEVLKIILNIGEVLNGKLLLYDGLQHNLQTISFERNQAEIENGQKKGFTLLASAIRPKVIIVNDVAFSEVLKNLSYLIIDIRESYVEPKFDHPQVHEVAVSQLETFLINTAKNQPILLCCQTGKISLMAAEYLMKEGFNNVSSLENGFNAYQKKQ